MFSRHSLRESRSVPFASVKLSVAVQAVRAVLPVPLSIARQFVQNVPRSWILIDNERLLLQASQLRMATRRHRTQVLGIDAERIATRMMEFQKTDVLLRSGQHVNESVNKIEATKTRDLHNSATSAIYCSEP